VKGEEKESQDPSNVAAAALKAWKEHSSRNQSVIVDLMQGILRQEAVL
tara:strand:- start:3759 stop:3902 length:144 start_codon:yes stop_codon:yes gene_type:complete